MSSLLFPLFSHCLPLISLPTPLFRTFDRSLQQCHCFCAHQIIAGPSRTDIKTLLSSLLYIQTKSKKKHNANLPKNHRKPNHKMCHRTSTHYQVCGHHSNPKLHVCAFADRDRTASEMQRCLDQSRQPPTIIKVSRACPECVGREEYAALAAAAFWQRMEQGVKDANRRIREEEKEEKQKNGNYLWRKVLNRFRKS